MKRMRKIAVIVAAAMVLTTSGAFACTGVHVGKNVSAEGTTLIARSEDQPTGGAYNKRFMVQPRVTKKGRYFKDTGTGFKVKLPKTTYKYTYVPDSSDANDGMYPASCANEYGLSVVGTVSTFVNSEYARIDPCTKENKGLREAILPALVVGQARTAREGCKVLAKLIDKYGSAENNTLLLADKKGAWIFEIYGGHSYCAKKLSNDKVSVFGNHIMIGWVDPDASKAKAIYSKNLFKNLKKVSTVVKKDGKYHIARSIDQLTDEGTRKDSYNMRDWAGMLKLAGADAAGEYDASRFYPLEYSPSKDVSVLDVMDLYRYRYQGTDYDLNKPENEGMYYPIGKTAQSDVHIMQVFSKLPKDCNTVQWLSMSNAEGSVFVPAFSGITDTHKAYKVDGTAYQSDSAYWMFKRNNTLAQSSRKYLMSGTQTFWKAQEKAELKTIKKAVKKVRKEYKKSQSDGRDYVTELGKDMAQKQLNNSDVLYTALQFVASNNDNDRTSEAGKEVFRKPVNLKQAARAQDFKVKIKGNKINLTRKSKGKKIRYTFVLKSREYQKNGKYQGDMSYPVFKAHGVIWAPANFADYLK